MYDHWQIWQLAGRAADMMYKMKAISMCIMIVGLMGVALPARADDPQPLVGRWVQTEKLAPKDALNNIDVVSGKDGRLFIIEVRADGSCGEAYANFNVANSGDNSFFRGRVTGKKWQGRMANLGLGMDAGRHVRDTLILGVETPTSVMSRSIPMSIREYKRIGPAKCSEPDPAV